MDNDGSEENLNYNVSIDKDRSSSSNAEAQSEVADALEMGPRVNEDDHVEEDKLTRHTHNGEPQGSEATSSAFEFSQFISHGPGLNITKYIPVGCLRVRRTHCSISTDCWMACQTQWQAFNHPRDAFGYSNARYMPMPLQEKVLLEADLSPIRALHHAAWVRIEFKSSNEHWGVVRVYILPDDIARAEIDRNQSSLRKALIVLLNSLDISKAAWNSQCSEADQFVGILSPTPDKDIEEPSLFDLFNTLPSPNPQPETITESYIQDAMYQILENKVEGISTTLYSYQQQTAAMMLQRETKPAQIIDPRLSVFLDQHDKPWYCDASTGTILREPKFYEAARGGICAETMGLGKTLICLAVILATKELSSKIPEEVLGNLPVRKKTGTLLEMAASNIGQNGSPWRHWLTRMESEGYELTNVRRALEKALGHYFLQPPAPRRVSRNPAKQAPRKILLSSTTIVVVPPNLVQQWLREIDKHTIEGSLNVLLMDDWKKELPAAEKLLEYDIILFSKPRFEYEARDQQLNDDAEDSSSRRINNNKKRSNGTNAFYRSPLEDIHFKRLIIDEGHTFGNATRSSKTEATTVVDFLRLSARWIISGTPTKGLYGIEVASRNSSKSSIPHSTPSDSSGILHNGSPISQAPPSDTESSRPAKTLSQPQIERLYVHERKDIEKLGNIATLFLKIRPWANSPDDQDAASWSQYVMQPRHGSKSRGNTDCLRKTLEGMIIRHRPEDVIKDVTLPPLHHDFVYLDGSIQNKLSLNTFAMMIITNAVTSERKDADYFFHSRQRKNLQQLVSNLRQGSFFWSGFETEHVQSTVNNAKKFLEERKVPVTAEDEGLLLQAIRIGEIVLANNISQLISSSHDMPMYIENYWDEEIRKAWALDRDIRNPTLMGATLVHNAQRLVQSQLYKTDPMEGLIEAGNKNMHAAFEPHNIRPSPDPLPVRRSKSLKRLRPAEVPPELAGGVTVGDGSSPRKKSRASATRNPALGEKVNDIIPHTLDPLSGPSLANGDGQPRADEIPRKSVVPPLKPALKQSSKADLAGTLDPNSPLASTFIVSTASVKLSYLMDRIVAHHASEKIIVFYESDNVAYYIAQGLECLGIKHLIYAKSLHSSRRSKYVVTFNQTEVFRVLLMDVSQAAFGLDLSSASRVFFVNPVFSPQVEAQAVKRAHRIGQVRPVHVETLVLKGSIEEVILKRRRDMSEQEHQKCKTILDDQTMYDWIQNVRFLDVPSESVPGPEQMAALEHKQALFRAGISVGDVADPDADLVGDPTPKKSPKGKNKRVKLSFAITDDRDGT